MELENVLKTGSSVWIYSKYNSKTIELSKKVNNNGGESFDIFIKGKVVFYDSEKDVYECECDYNGESVSIIVDRDMVHKADEEFGYKDNSQLRNLNIGNVLRNVQVCYELLNADSDHIGIVNRDSCPKYQMYSFAGGILLAVNPYKYYDIYNEHVANEFIGKNIMNMEPHPFAIAEWSYRRMLNDKRSQSIIISGESGAGKTETSKHVLKYLSFVSNKQRTREIDKMRVESNTEQNIVTIEECLLSSNPLLEVFGNSKTIRNCNSSRFGKYMKLEFDSNGKIINSRINTYLLEKSRVVHLPDNERNYHIFYHMLNEITHEQKKRWGLMDDKYQITSNLLEFNYLKTENSSRCDNSGNVLDYNFCEIMKTVPYNMNTINESFNSIGVNTVFREYIYDMVASILLLGNLEYKSVRNQEDECELTEESLFIIDKIAKIWEFESSNELIELLTIKKIVKIKKRLSCSEAVYTRDSISRYLYEWIFNTVVEFVNIALKQKLDFDIENVVIESDNMCDKVPVKNNSIGILDIFGFEDLEPNYINSFEQLLINYCNERLHSFFLEQLLYRDTVLYKTEGINDKISTLPSSNVIDLLFKQSFVCTVLSGVNPRYLNDNNEEYECKGSSSNISPFKEKLDNNNLLVSLLPYNVISILDEAGKIPMKGNRDHAFCNKVHMLNKLSNEITGKSAGVSRSSICSSAINNMSDVGSLSSEKLLGLSDAISAVIQVQKLNTDKTFTINHFAGPVKYTCSEFISKNTDFLSNNIENVLLSKIRPIREIDNLKNNLQNSICTVVDGEDSIKGSNSCNALDNANTLELKLESEKVDRKLRMSVAYLNNISNSSINQVPTPINTSKNKSVSTKFVRQVQDMLDNELYSTQSHFIRCIKPNNSQVSLFFDSEKVYKQLKIGGILQILSIMIYGYPYRVPYCNIYKYFKQVIELDENSQNQENRNAVEVNEKAKLLLSDDRLFVSLLLEYMGYARKVDYQLGLTRVFFKYNVLDKIEQFIKNCEDENSLEWKIGCINSLYNHWVKRRCLNYWNMFRCCFKIYLLYKYIRKNNAIRVIGKYAISYIELKRERRREEEERMALERERIRREQEEMERRKEEERMALERERIRREQEEMERRKEEERMALERERIRREQEEMERRKEEERRALERERVRREQEEMERRKEEERRALERERVRREQEEMERREEEERRALERERIRREQEEMERIKEEERRALERERVRMEQEEMERRKEEERRALEREKITQKGTMKRSRDYEEYNEELCSHDSLEIDKKKRATCVFQSNNDEIQLDKQESDNDLDFNSNSPLLCTSAARGSKRYSAYYVTGNETMGNFKIEARTLQDEIVEAEFNDEILNGGRTCEGGTHMVSSDYHNNCDSGSLTLDNSCIKTGIKRPTVFINNDNITEFFEEKENMNGDNEEMKSGVSENSSSDLILIKKRSLKDIQENFRSNIIKQKETNKRR